MVEHPPMLPGQLGRPGMALSDDPRADPRMIKAMAPFGLAGRSGPSPVDHRSDLDAVFELCKQTEDGFESVVEALTGSMPAVEGVERTVVAITGRDGNEITLFVHRPVGQAVPLPSILHLHGGAMVMFAAAGVGYQRWRDSLAATGLVVVGVEFRNGAGRLGPHPFPAGLHDCVSALEWLHAHRKELLVSKIVVSGESGGGNLALATALLSKREGSLGLIDGVYAQCPYISNGYAHRDGSLPSLYENDAYVLPCDQMGALAKAYDPSRENAKNPLAWPLMATDTDLRGLPPHVVSVNELDPVRDEGLGYFRKLLDAGVPAVSRTVNGTCHSGDCLFPAAMPDVYAATIRDIKGFANSL
ncbi:MAG: alpha/beta hydrolase [Ilumatobacteraceae bacterium]|nr:alpha/beta hydrolase [Ilumatobacteraceae bacterium]